MYLEFSLIEIIILTLLGLGLVVGVILFFVWRRHRYNTKVIIPRTLSWAFLEIRVPKTSGNKENDHSNSPEDRAKLIAVAEQLFTTLSEIGKESFFNQRDYISLEIACIAKKINFYINCPKELVSVIEKQLNAQYPAAQIELVKGYNPFQKNGTVKAVELALAKKFVYPFRTYKSMETDPLNAITNAMSKLEEDESLVMQVVISPAGSSWQYQPRRMASEVQQGKSPEIVEKGIFGRMLADFSKGFFHAAKGQDPTHANKPDQIHPDLSGMYNPIHLTPMQQEIVKRLEEKASRPGFKTNIRLLSSSPHPGNAALHLSNLSAAVLQYSMPPFNGLRQMAKKEKDVIRDYLLRVYRSYGKKMILNTEELASLWHLPTPSLETPNINWLKSKRAQAPLNIPKEGIRLGKNVYRGVETEVKIAKADRSRHMYMLGRTGSGKSYLMANMAIQDIANGEGVCVIDPHGDLIADVLARIPKERAEDVIVFEPFDTDRPMGLNMLEVSSEEQKDFVVQEMISIFYKLVTDPAMLGPMFEHNMRNAMLTLMADQEHPGTIVEIPRMFTDTEFQSYKIAKVKDPVVRAFWEKEMAKTSDFHKSEMLGYLISKVGRFVENATMRNIVGQPKSGFNFREIMDDGKILLVNLSKGRVGEINAKLLGLILVSKIQMAALSRADIPESERKDFYLYVDEFQNFITDAFASILSEARKYKLNLIIAHQYLGQLTQAAGSQGAATTDLRDAVFGNAGTVLTFRTSAEDAEFLVKEFSPTFSEFDLVNIDRYNAYIKLMINGTASKPFNMATYNLPDTANPKIADAIKQLSRLKYGRPKAEVEEEILEASQIAEMMTAGVPATEKTL